MKRQTVIEIIKVMELPVNARMRLLINMETSLAIVFVIYGKPI